MGSLNGQKVAMIIAHEGFRDEELSVPLEMFKREGAEVKIASSSLDMAKGKLGMTVKPDVLYSNINVKDYDAIVFVGGPGSTQYWDDPVAHRIAKDAVSLGKVLAAICAAPPILANAGVLKRKRATCFPSDEGPLIAGHAQYTAKAVEADGTIVTGNGPQSAGIFAKEIVRLLGNKKGENR